MARRRRELGEEERALWRRVTATVKPLRPEPGAPGSESSPGGDVAVEVAVAAGADGTPSMPAIARPPAPPRPAPSPRQHPEPLDHGVAPGLDRRSLDRLRRGRVPVESVLDLHGHRQDEAHEFLRRFLASSQAAGRRCVLVVTGKGLRRNLSGEVEAGVLRRMVPVWLNDTDNRGRVLAFCHATPPHGGAGALYVLLKRIRKGG